MKIRNIIPGLIFILAAQFAAAQTTPVFTSKAFSEQSAKVDTVLNNAKTQQQPGKLPPPPNNKMIFDAITANNLKWTREIFSQYTIDINYQNEEGKTALMMATKKNTDIALIQLLLMYNPGIYIKDKDDRTAMIHAVRNDHLEAARLLGRLGSPVDDADKFGWTPMRYAITNQNLEMIEMLADVYHAKMQTRSEGEKTAVFYAIDTDNPKVLLYVIMCGGHVFYKGEDGMEPMMYAARLNKPAMLTALLRAVGNDDRMNNQNSLDFDRTALMYAAALGNKECVRVLLDWGANRDIRDSKGNTAYDYAFIKGNKEVADLLKMP